jgi:hypothetical protein
MSKINTKPNWQSSKSSNSYESPQVELESHDQSMRQNYTKENNQQVEQQSSGLDVNLIIASFQEKLAQLTTELVVKDATIKQLTNIINSMRGQK